MLQPGDDAGARFRVRHDPCGAITDVSLPMLRNGWVCQACKLGGLTARGWVQGRSSWSLEQQEQLMTVAGLRPLVPLMETAPGDQPLNVECITCGGAQTNSLFGFSEGVRLSWPRGQAGGGSAWWVRGLTRSSRTTVKWWASPVSGRHR